MTHLVQGGCLDAPYASWQRAYTRKCGVGWRRETERNLVSARLLCCGDDMSVCVRFVITEVSIDVEFDRILLTHVTEMAALVGGRKTP